MLSEVLRHPDIHLSVGETDVQAHEHSTTSAAACRQRAAMDEFLSKARALMTAEEQVCIHTSWCLILPVCLCLGSGPGYYRSAGKIPVVHSPLLWLHQR